MDQIREFMDEFQHESDRAAAVLAGAYLDSKLEELLQSKFVRTPEFVKELLSGNGGLSHFSARISTAYAVGLISLNVAEDLHVVRRIRNEFAHRMHGLSFKAQRITELVRCFRILQALRTKNGTKLPLPTDPRKRFNLAVALLLLYGIQSRIREMPKFKEPAGTTVIYCEPF